MTRLLGLGRNTSADPANRFPQFAGAPLHTFQKGEPLLERVRQFCCERQIAKRAALDLEAGGDNGLPVAMERKLALRKSAALRECQWDGAMRPSELIRELQVTANQHMRVFVVKVRRNLFPNLSLWGGLTAQ